MVAIDRGSAEIALLVDAEFRLAGTVSDGDIRRALLAGIGLSDPVLPHASTRPHTVPAGTPRAQVLELMRALSINQIPVVDLHNHVVELHLLQELLGRRQRPNVAVVTTDGAGAAAPSDPFPKFMRRVAGRPILERIVLHLVGSGIERVFLCVDDATTVVQDHFGDGSALGCAIEYVQRDPSRVGTCGSLRRVLEHCEPTAALLVMNSDLVRDFSVENLLGSHDHSGALATVAVESHSHLVPFGVAETVGTRLVRLVEKPTQTWLVDAGIYVLDPSLLRRLAPDSEGNDIPALLSDCIATGDPVATWQVDYEWQDLARSAPPSPSGSRDRVSLV